MRQRIQSHLTKQHRGQQTCRCSAQGTRCGVWRFVLIKRILSSVSIPAAAAGPLLRTDDKLSIRIGTYVTHAKLPDLGSGEVTSMDGERLVIRFSSGERNFIYHLVEKHLNVTQEAPAPAKPSRAAKKSAAPKKSATPKGGAAPKETA